MNVPLDQDECMRQILLVVLLGIHFPRFHYPLRFPKGWRQSLQTSAGQIHHPKCLQLHFDTQHSNFRFPPMACLPGAIHKWCPQFFFWLFDPALSSPPCHHFCYSFSSTFDLSPSKDDDGIYGRPLSPILFWQTVYFYIDMSGFFFNFQKTA